MELGEALRIGPNLFSERPDAPILRRLRRHLLPKEGGYGTSSCGTGDTNVNSVTLTSYSSPRSGDTTTLGPKGRRPPSTQPAAAGGHNLRGEAPSTFPSEPFEPFEPSEPGAAERPPYPICFFLPSHDIMTSVSGVIAQLVRALR